MEITATYYLTPAAMSASIQMSSVDAAIGARARALRKGARMSLRDLSDLAGFSYTYLSELERGEKRWSIERINEVAAALEVSPALLQDTTIPLDRIHEVADILAQLSDLPAEKLPIVVQLLEAMRS